MLLSVVIVLALPLIRAGHHPRRHHRSRHREINNNHFQRWSLSTGCIDQTKPVAVDLGLSACLTTCEEEGYPWANLELESCFCASGLNSTACDNQVYRFTAPFTIAGRSSSSRSSLDQWSYQGCTSDTQGRVLPYEVDSPNMTPGMCISTCSALGYVYAGIESGNQCFCGNTLGAGAGYLPESACSTKCANSLRGCGGGFAIALWQASPGSGSDAGVSANDTPGNVESSGASGNGAGKGTATGTATSVFGTATASLAIASTGSITAVSVTSTSSPIAAATATPVSASVPASGNTKYVWAHHMVGNTYPYGYGDWMTDISLAQGAGIDGFVLNIGTDSWQPARVADAYSAAQNAGFKMMLSLDMTVFPCNDWSSVSTLQSYLNTYLNHPAAARINGVSALTTFAGDTCTFGQSSTNAGWAAVIGSLPVYFMPAYFGSQSSLGSDNIQGGVNWDNAWPKGSSDIDTSSDWSWINSLGGKGYVATISPLFNTHLSYKNWIYRSDDWLFAMRWEQVISMRSQIDQVEILTWNDYGESHYIGPIAGALPAGSELYANSDFPHSDILSLNAFYASAWKNGYYPAITYDQAWVMARPHPASATASSDPYGQPTGSYNSQDNFYAQVHLTASASVTLCASSCKTFTGNAGINRFSYPLQVGSGMSVTVSRNGQTTVNLAPNFTFNGSPSLYNFNYLIKSS